MIVNGYFVIKFNGDGVEILSAYINNVFERVMFIEKENASKFMKIYNKNNDLCVYHVEAYANNKILYEDNKDIINNISSEKLMIV